MFSQHPHTDLKVKYHRPFTSPILQFHLSAMPVLARQYAVLPKMIHRETRRGTGEIRNHGKRDVTGREKKRGNEGVMSKEMDSGGVMSKDMDSGGVMSKDMTVGE